MDRQRGGEGLDRSKLDIVVKRMVLWKEKEVVKA